MYGWWRSWEQNVVTSWYSCRYIYIFYGNLKCQSNGPLKSPHFVTNFELKILLHFILQPFLAEFWDQILLSSIFDGTKCLLTFVAGFWTHFMEPTILPAFWTPASRLFHPSPDWKIAFFSSRLTFLKGPQASLPYAWA